MFDLLDLSLKLDKAAYREQLPRLQSRLYDMEQALFQAHVPVVVVFEGWAGTSKIGTISQLTRRLDPRGFRVHPITPPRTYETQYPWLYRFWLKIPACGQITFFDRSWYREVLEDRVRDRIDPIVWRQRCSEIVSFERQLVDDGGIVLKFWFHITRKEQRRRLDKLNADPLTAWQVTDDDRWQLRHYKRVHAAAEDLLVRTDMPGAPWVLIPSTDRRYTSVAVFEALLHALERRLGYVASLNNVEEPIDETGAALRRQRSSAQSIAAPPRQLPALVLEPDEQAIPRTVSVLRQIDLGARMNEAAYQAEIAQLQAKMYLLGLQIYRQQRPVVLVFEGWDAAGKGGAIKRVTEKLDPRAYVVHSISAPAGDDRERHYLYRFWRRLPQRGMIGIFDRSWYGRVLVERVEGFAQVHEWQRAYAEINEFEEQLMNFGTVVCKFWLHISPEEQLRRFEERQRVPYKAWKLTDEDWRNRARWGLYEEAADEMLLRTSTPIAPWTVVAAEDKRFARITVLRTLVRRLEDALGPIKL